MPEVMQVDEFSFWIHAWDEDPPRVHVERAGRWSIIVIGDDEEKPSTVQWGDMRSTDSGRAVWIVNQCREILLAHWRRVHAP